MDNRPRARSESPAPPIPPRRRISQQQPVPSPLAGPPNANHNAPTQNGLNFKAQKPPNLSNLSIQSSSVNPNLQSGNNSPKHSSTFYHNGPNNGSALRQSGSPRVSRGALPSSPRHQAESRNSWSKLPVRQADVNSQNKPIVPNAEASRASAKPAIPPRSLSQDRQSSAAHTQRWIHEQNTQLNSTKTADTSKASGQQNAARFKSHLQFDPVRPQAEQALPHNRSQESLDRLSIRAFESSENLQGLTSPMHPATQQQRYPQQQRQQQQQHLQHQQTVQSSNQRSLAQAIQSPLHRTTPSSPKVPPPTQLTQPQPPNRTPAAASPWAGEPRADVTGINSISLHLKNTASSGHTGQPEQASVPSQPPQLPARSVGQSNFYSSRDLAPSPLSLPTNSDHFRMRAMQADPASPAPTHGNAGSGHLSRDVTQPVRPVISLDHPVTSTHCPVTPTNSVSVKSPRDNNTLLPLSRSLSCINRHNSR